MIYVGMPLGTTHGWGVCGRMITRELSRLVPVELYTNAFAPGLVEDELEYWFLKGLLPEGTDLSRMPEGGEVDGPVLRGIPAFHEDYKPKLRGTYNVGYCFFEDNLTAPANSARQFAQFDFIAAGSTWCADILRATGRTNVGAVLQGVDLARFNPVANEKVLFEDKFVVYSGGKLELRKGQDLVIRAIQVLQERHKDVMLVNLWHNTKASNAQTILSSPHIKVPGSFSGDFVQVVNQLLAFNGVDMGRVVTLAGRANAMMPSIYKNTDVVLFPNRCESGTNLVMMEYMACGKPVVASYNSGHCDVLTDENSIPIRGSHKQIIRRRDGSPGAEWDEPDLEETIEKLEWAYRNRQRIREIGKRAGEDLGKMTWAETARQFYRILTKG